MSSIYFQHLPAIRMCRISLNFGTVRTLRFCLDHSISTIGPPHSFFCNCSTCSTFAGWNDFSDRMALQMTGGHANVVLAPSTKDCSLDVVLNDLEL